MGAHLARIELQAFYRVVPDTLPEFRLDPDYPPVLHEAHARGPAGSLADRLCEWLVVHGVVPPAARRSR